MSRYCPECKHNFSDGFDECVYCGSELLEGTIEIEDNENGLYSNELRKMQKSNKLYIINMTGVAYERDYISGEIIEYPFEDMDPTQELESYKNDNALILEVTSNKNKKLTNKEILKSIVLVSLKSL